MAPADGDLVAGHEAARGAPSGLTSSVATDAGGGFGVCASAAVWCSDRSRTDREGREPGLRTPSRGPALNRAGLIIVGAAFPRADMLRSIAKRVRSKCVGQPVLATRSMQASEAWLSGTFGPGPASNGCLRRAAPARDRIASVHPAFAASSMQAHALPGMN